MSKEMSTNEITDKLMSGDLSRRQFSQMLAAAGVCLATVPASMRSATAAAEDQASYFTWGGYDIPELFEPYISKHGEAPNFAAFGGSEEALTNCAPVM